MAAVTPGTIQSAYLPDFPELIEATLFIHKERIYASVEFLLALQICHNLDHGLNKMLLQSSVRYCQLMSSFPL